MSGGLELRLFINGAASKGEKPLLAIPVRIVQGERPDVFIIKEDGYEDEEIDVRGHRIVRRFAIVDSLMSRELLSFGRDERVSAGGSPIKFAHDVGKFTFLVTLKR